MDSMHEGRFLRLVRKSGWEYAERTNASGAVCILAITEDDEILLVEQFRIPLDNRTIEMPAGLVGDIESDQGPEDAARRELIEETGYLANSMIELLEVCSSPGMISETTIIFKAKGLVKVSVGGGDKSEDIKVHKVRLEVLSGWLDLKRGEGYMLDAKLYTCLYFL